MLGQRPSHATKLNAIHIFDMIKKEWTIVENPGGVGPTPRCLSAYCVVGYKIYVFGGYQPSDTAAHAVFNGMYIFDTETLTWTHLETNGICPDPRAGCGMWYYKEKLYLFGGSQGKQVYFGDVYSYCIETNEWRIVETKGKRGNGDFSNAVDNSNGNENSGSRPLRMCCFSCNVFENMVYIFGGLTANEEYENQSTSNVMYILDMETLKWNRPSYASGNSVVPPPRCSHTCQTLWPVLILAGGGNTVTKSDFDQHVYMYHLVENKWYRLTDYFFGSHFPKLIGLSSAYCIQTKEIFFIGGKDPEDNLKYCMYCIDCQAEKLIKEKVFSSSVAPYSRKSLPHKQDVQKKDTLSVNTETRGRSISLLHRKHLELNNEDSDCGEDSPLEESPQNIKQSRRKTLESISKFFKIN